MFFNNVRVVGDTVLFSVNRLDDSVPMVKVLSVMNRWYECEVQFNNVQGWTIEFKVSEEVDDYEGPTLGYGNLRVLISKESEGFIYNLDGHMDCGFFQWRERFTTAACCDICSDMWGMCPCIPCNCGFLPHHDVMWCTTNCVVCGRLSPQCQCYSGFEVDFWPPIEADEEPFANWNYTCSCGAPDGCCDC